jgi:hypothetical protein
VSTRSSIYYHERTEDTPHIHIFTEMLDDPPLNIRMEIETPYALIDIPLPVDLQEMLGLKRVAKS